METMANLEQNGNLCFASRRDLVTIEHMLWLRRKNYPLCILVEKKIKIFYWRFDLAPAVKSVRAANMGIVFSFNVNLRLVPFPFGCFFKMHSRRWLSPDGFSYQVCRKALKSHKWKIPSPTKREEAKLTVGKKRINRETEKGTESKYYRHYRGSKLWTCWSVGWKKNRLNLDAHCVAQAANFPRDKEANAIEEIANQKHSQRYDEIYGSMHILPGLFTSFE